MTKTIIKTLVLALALAVPALAQKSSAPAPGPAKPFKVPPRQSFTLPNGLVANMVPYGNIPKVQITVAVRAASIDEGANQVWLADLTGLLMREGTKAKTAEEVDAAFARMGGQLTINTSNDQTLITADVLSTHAAEAAALLAEVTTSPRLPEADVARLKNDLLRRLAVAKTQPGQLAFERFRRTLYPDHPYGRVFATEEMIKGYTQADAQKFYDQNFGAQRTRVYVAGKFDPAPVKAALTKGFSGWAKGPAPLVNIPKPSTARAFELVEKPGAVQSTLYIGLAATDPSNPDYVPLLVTHTMLGGSFISRITQNIRENKGYTYSPGAQLSIRYRDAYWVEVADVQTKDTGNSMKEIFGEIDGLRTTPPPADEVARIQRYMSGVFVLQNSSRGGLINMLNTVDLHGVGDDYLRTYVQKVNAVTAADVQRMAQKYIDPARMTIVVVGDKEKISEQIAPYQTAAMKK
jgi:predicted Zn-dependent peptidase